MKTNSICSQLEMMCLPWGVWSCACAAVHGDVRPMLMAENREKWVDLPWAGKEIHLWDDRGSVNDWMGGGGGREEGGRKWPKTPTSRQASRGQSAEWAWCDISCHPLPVGCISGSEGWFMLQVTDVCLFYWGTGERLETATQVFDIYHASGEVPFLVRMRFPVASFNVSKKHFLQVWIRHKTKVLKRKKVNRCGGSSRGWSIRKWWGGSGVGGAETYRTVVHRMTVDFPQLRCAFGEGLLSFSHLLNKTIACSCL